MSSDFSLLGIGSGIDFSVYIDAIRNSEEQALARTLGRRQAVTEAKKAIMSDIKGRLDSLKNSASGFKYAKDFKTKTVTSTDQDVVTATSKVTTPISTATIRVDRLATNEIWTGSFTGVDDSVSSTDGVFTITHRGVQHDVEVTSGSTLSELAELINSQNFGVTATVFDMGDGSGTSARMTLTDNTLGKFDSDQTPGSNFNIALSSTTLTEFDETDFGATPTIEGFDSQFYLNGDAGNAVYRDTNTLTDVLPGLTLKLHSEDNSEFKTLSVSESTNAASGKIEDFIEKYNEVIQILRQAIKFNPEEEVQSNPTAGDSTLRNILTSLQSMVSGDVSTLPSGNEIRSLADLGVTSIFNAEESAENGNLEFDAEVFQNALDENFDDVVQFFEGITTNGEKFVGFGEKTSNILNAMVKPITGSLTSKIKSLGEESSRIEDEIEVKLERIDKKVGLLQERFARLEVQLAELNSQQSALTSALQAVTNNNTAISNSRR